MADAQPAKERRKRADNEGTKRPSGRWEVRVTLPSGKRKAFTGTTQGEALRKRDKYLKDLDAGLDPDASKLTVGAYLDWWVKDREADIELGKLRPATLASYRGHIDHHLKTAFGGVLLRSLSVRQVNTLLASIVEAGRSPATANRVRATLRAALADAVNDGKIPRNVAKHADPQPEQRHEVQPPSVEQLRRFFDLTAFHPLGPLFVVAAHTGLRQGELLALTWDDIELVAGVLHVRKTASIGKDGKRSRNAPKTEKSAGTLALTPQAIRALKTQRSRVETLEMAAAERWKENGLVFPSTVGTLANPSNVTHRFQALLKEHGFPRWRFHDLRHATASILLANGASLAEVQKVLRHSSYALTANLYTHLTPELAERNADRMASAFGDDATNDATETA